jgi:pimeloyl-ACP methyl ester carboxylesterase
MAYEYSEEHFIADWSTSRGQSGTVVFVAVNSHILLDSPDTAAWLTNSGKSSYFISEFASLGKYGGSGHPVIFVHGLLSSPSAWDDMIRKFEEDGHFSKYEIWRFGYDTRQPFETIGPEFYALAGEAGLLDRAPFLVAHSMGGIVSRSYIALGGKFTRLVTLGTPHCGTPTGAGGVFTGPGTLEMSPCTPELQALYAQEVVFNDFPNFAVVSGKLTGGWQWVTVSKCSTVCVLSHCSTACVDVPVYLWQFDRDYNTALKAGWLFVNALSFGDNDGAVPTSSANFCSRGIDNFPCDICPPIDFASNKHLTNYDHFMLLDPSTAPDVYHFVVNHLKAP